MIWFLFACSFSEDLEQAMDQARVDSIEANSQRESSAKSWGREMGYDVIGISCFQDLLADAMNVGLHCDLKVSEQTQPIRLICNTNSCFRELDATEKK